MRALLDTHAFLWWNMDDARLSTPARNFIADGRNQVFLRAVSGWEIAIKSSRGRLQLPLAPDRYVTQRLAHYGFQVLPVDLSHALHVHALPWFHSDPFDRLLVVQSQLEQMPLISGDSEIAHYGVQIIW